ncbi:hypothetical protein PFICI_06822 [Pestalotiopsis fici W106-1]|uniref:Uncharacterized protein n=1 Tax=Pestalotiopsis fici (strain W106-1 / CGMCC3.15140) TaxID=1229662 RepID=W3X6Z5_PESFW|nr:uncharacterized protein PFICI_06822 [Pestalotiopsis fici W106-1]ETS81820.1 hypothetical protein PFICI_06822 [Pestalotiopsis fici W106-1]
MADPQQVEQPIGADEVEATAAIDNSGTQQTASTPFQPIYTLVNNTSTRTTHHPRVKYIFSDDDPDELMQALAQQDHANLGESASGPAPDHRAILLDLTSASDGTLNVSWASSLSPSWAVLDAQVTKISPPSSDGGGNSDPTASPTQKKPDRLMLRIEGIDGGSLASDSELRLSDEKSRLGSSGSASGSGQRVTETEDYNALVDEFDKRMSLLRKVVDAGEERRRKVAEGTGLGPNVQHDIPPEAVPTSTENLRKSVDSG